MKEEPTDASPGGNSCLTSTASATSSAWTSTAPASACLVDDDFFPEQSCLTLESFRGEGMGPGFGYPMSSASSAVSSRKDARGRRFYLCHVEEESLSAGTNDYGMHSLTSSYETPSNAIASYRQSVQLPSRRSSRGVAQGPILPRTILPTRTSVSTTAASSCHAAERNNGLGWKYKHPNVCANPRKDHLWPRGDGERHHRYGSHPLTHSGSAEASRSLDVDADLLLREIRGYEADRECSLLASVTRAIEYFHQREKLGHVGAPSVSNSRGRPQEYAPGDVHATEECLILRALDHMRQLIRNSESRDLIITRRHRRMSLALDKSACALGQDVPTAPSVALAKASYKLFFTLAAVFAHQDANEEVIESLKICEAKQAIWRPEQPARLYYFMANTWEKLGKLAEAKRSREFANYLIFTECRTSDATLKLLSAGATVEPPRPEIPARSSKGCDGREAEIRKLALQPGEHLANASAMRCRSATISTSLPFEAPNQHILRDDAGHIATTVAPRDLGKTYNSRYMKAAESSATGTGLKGSTSTRGDVSGAYAQAEPTRTIEIRVDSRLTAFSRALQLRKQLSLTSSPAFDAGEYQRSILNLYFLEATKMAVPAVRQNLTVAEYWMLADASGSIVETVMSPQSQAVMVSCGRSSSSNTTAAPQSRVSDGTESTTRRSERSAGRIRQIRNASAPASTSTATLPGRPPMLRTELLCMPLVPMTQ